jgi:hypothetical protein
MRIYAGVTIWVGDVQHIAIATFLNLDSGNIAICYSIQAIANFTLNIDTGMEVVGP